MRVMCTAFLLPAALLSVAGAASAQREVTVRTATVRSLDARLRTFAQSLAPAERAAWETVLRQAAAAPADNPSGVPVRATFYAGCGCTTVAPGAIIVQGGRTAASPFIIVQGGTHPSPGGNPTASQGVQASGPSPAIIVQGGTQPSPGGNPAGTQPGRGVGPGGGCLGMAPRAAGVGGGPAHPGNSAAIGPKPDDPLVALNAKVHAFAATLSGDEQATFDWLLQRAATQGQRGPGGTPAGRAPSLGQALGLLAIGPKQDDPAPPPPSDLHVMLRF